MRVHFADPKELHRHAERGGLAYAWEFTRAFAKWQELLAREQYDLVNVRTSQGTSRVMLFSRAMGTAGSGRARAMASDPGEARGLPTCSSSALKSAGASRYASSCYLHIARQGGPPS